MNKYASRLMSSDRGEDFNPLIWPFLLATFSYGIGFTLIYPLSDTQGSSLYQVMHGLAPWLPMVWGIACIAIIMMGLTYLLFNKPPWGRVSGMLGFMLWIFAAGCYAIELEFVVLFALAVPQAWFWGWQWLSLRRFRKENVEDTESMRDFGEKGGYREG